MPIKAAEVIDMMVAADAVTFDEFMRRDPKTLTDEDRLHNIEVMRRDRARWDLKQEAKRDKKAGITTTEDEE